MRSEHFGTYLNDHLAGSVVALELLEHLVTAQQGQPVAQALAELRAEIAVDREALEALIGRLGFTESRPRQALAWIAEKVARLKLVLEDTPGGSMRLFEGLEAVAIGIEGKRALWQVLGTLAEEQPELRGLDYPRLIERSVAQRNQIEVWRIDAARAAFSLRAEPAE